MATRKPVSQLAPAQRQRLERYAASHPGADLDDSRVRRAAFGHEYTPEHGSHIPHPPYNDRTVYTTASGQEARRLLNNMSKIEGQRVSIAVEEKAKPGHWHHLYSNTPMTAEYLMHDPNNPDRVGRERNLKKWLEKQEIAAHGGQCPGFHVKNIRRIQITRYHVKPKPKAA